MRIIGCDLQRGQQTLAMLGTATGGIEKTDSEARREHRARVLSKLSWPVRVEIAATSFPAASADQWVHRQI